MAAQALIPANAEKSPNEPTEGMRFVARQPILDLRGRIHGYELLFRSGPEMAFRGDGDVATRTMLDNTVIFGLEKLTGGLPAFVNCTAEALTGDLVHVLPASTTVLEILETIEPTEALVASCCRLKNFGYRLALDDFLWQPKLEPLVDLADYIKVDLSLSDAKERKSLIHRYRHKAIAMLAEKVETQEQYEQACAEGFTLFQGYYFCRPVLMRNREVPANRLFHFEILRLLNQETVDFRQLCRLVKRDASLAYRFLRLVNSPVYAIRQEVRSIESALVVVGEDGLRRVVTLAIAGELILGRPAEILRMALIRARFCELAAGMCALDATEQYMLGMLSLLSAMLQIPMETLTPALPLRREIRDALEGAENPDRTLLTWLECHEQGDWARSEAVAAQKNLNQDRLNACYLQAVPWAEVALRLTT
jgi:EAL and modified HD-GYP domain-containing signal transduction protein